MAKQPPTGEKALVPTPTTTDYMALTIKEAELRQVLADNLGPRGIQPLDLDRVRVPAGGGITWLVPSLSGEEETKEITGIVIFWKELRTYWATSFDQGERRTPPDCSADDGIQGVGTPGGYCVECPLAQWGSSPKGNEGQACRLLRVLFLLRPGEILPLLMVVPTMSIKPTHKYFLRLLGKGIHYYGAVSQFTLEKVENRRGKVYSRIVPSVVPNGILDEATREAVKTYAEAIIPALRFVTVASDDYPMTSEEEVSESSSD